MVEIDFIVFVSERREWDLKKTFNFIKKILTRASAD